MGFNRKGQLVKSGEYWKHMKWMKRIFWHRERRAEETEIKKAIEENARSGSGYPVIR